MIQRRGDGKERCSIKVAFDFPQSLASLLIAPRDCEVNPESDRLPEASMPYAGEKQISPRVTPASQILLKLAYFGLKVLKGKR